MSRHLERSLINIKVWKVVWGLLAAPPHPVILPSACPEVLNILGLAKLSIK